MLVTIDEEIQYPIRNHLFL